MKIERFIDIMLSVCMASRAEAEGMLDIPVADLNLDSLDRELLRTALEKRLARPVGEKLWQESPTLRYLMDHLP